MSTTLFTLPPMVSTVKTPTHSGVIIGPDDFLTSGEFENLKAVPSIVFLNCCHLGQLADGNLADTHNSQPGHLAASLAQKLIEMGVSVVVVAGWAVGDQAAQIFAKTLYEHLLGGNTLMNAVRLARAATYSIGGANDLTWGAYQVYGDPGFTFYWVDRRSPTEIRDRVFVALDELQEHLQDFSQQVKGADDLKCQSLKRQLDELAQNIYPKWQNQGEITSELGKAYSELGYYSDAVFWYEKPLKPPTPPLRLLSGL
ncbi:MAG: CHAT domain-containing protein [Acaryochloridaceae cyanobacterium RL_2_7]|nr:CHAT domain-containing protein [Acaryochloridaceae cyanobacterium RL_2_7]